MTPFLAVLRVVKLLPQLQVTVVTTYSGWIPDFIANSWFLRSPGRRQRGRFGREPEPLIVGLPVCQTLQRAQAPGDSRRCGFRVSRSRHPEPATSAWRECSEAGLVLRPFITNSAFLLLSSF